MSTHNRLHANVMSIEPRGAWVQFLAKRQGTTMESGFKECGTGLEMDEVDNLDEVDKLDQMDDVDEMDG
jgi:hypothetical protein